MTKHSKNIATHIKAKLTVILDKRTANRLGRYPVKLRITHNNSNTTASTNIFISENAFTGKPENICVRTPVRGGG